jgi:molecular chaperone GrpE
MSVDHETSTQAEPGPGAADGAPSVSAHGAPAGNGPADDEDAGSATLRDELAEITQKADEYLKLAQRTQADFVNYRRRVEEERAQQARDATLGLIQRLLPILDDFERALAAASPQDVESGWGQGVALVERNLRGLLASENVERIEALGAEFDPRLHEAVGQAPSADVAEGHVLHVARTGYRKGDRVVRPAQVIVATAAPPAEAQPPG